MASSDAASVQTKKPASLVFFGATGGNRTRDAQFRKLSLYPLSYGGSGDAPQKRAQRQSTQMRMYVGEPQTAEIFT